MSCVYVYHLPSGHPNHGEIHIFFFRRKSRPLKPHRGGVGVVAALLAVGLGDLAVDHHHVGPEEVLQFLTPQKEIPGLVNIQKTMERSTILNGKTHYKLPFSIAMLNYQRVFYRY